MADATYHDFFIGGLGNWQKAFVSSKLDEWRDIPAALFATTFRYVLEVLFILQS